MTRALIDTDVLADLIADRVVDRLRGDGSDALADKIVARLAERERAALLDVDELAAKLNLTVGAVERIRARYNEDERDSPKAKLELAREFLGAMDELWRQHQRREVDAEAAVLKTLGDATKRLRAKGIAPSVIRRALRAVPVEENVKPAA